MQRLGKVFIIVMLIIYCALLAAPAWSADTPRDETVMLALSSDIPTLDWHNHIQHVAHDHHVAPG